jgi:hypothetical protein
MSSEEKEKPVPGPDPLLVEIEETLQQMLSQLQSIATALVPTMPTGVTRLIPLTEADLPLPVVPLPRGTIRAVADLNPTTSSFQAVVSYTVTQGKTFSLAKIVASCNSGYEVQLNWKGHPITVIYKQMGGSVLTDWFPSGYPDINLAPIVGDGTSQLQLMGRYPSGGTADDLWCEIVGEETG